MAEAATLREENEQLAQQIQTAAAAELQPLQGTWEGIDLGQNYSRKITIRFTGNSLHFQAPTNNEWAEGTFTLPAGTNPQQLRFTMKGCSNPDHIGQVVVAIFKVEGWDTDLGGEPRQHRRAAGNFSQHPERPAFSLRHEEGSTSKEYAATQNQRNRK